MKKKTAVEVKPKPCPFCGKNGTISTGEYFPGTLVYCSRVNCNGGNPQTRNFKYKDEAIAAWNRRHGFAITRAKPAARLPASGANP